MQALATNQITGLVLAGGRGSRMGGVDKGLQPFEGIALAQHALRRLAPQVGPLLINANRSIESYRAFGVPVVSDSSADFAGPLAGMLAGLTHCLTPYLLTVPCDSPYFPLDLGARLSEALLTSGASLATAYTSEEEHLLPQPVFCLMKAALQPDLRAFIARGERKTGFWSREQHGIQVVFSNAQAFANFNTLTDLTSAERSSADP